MGRARTNNRNRAHGRNYDNRRRRWIRRVLVGWVILTLIGGILYAFTKARGGRSLRSHHSRQVIP